MIITMQEADLTRDQLSTILDSLHRLEPKIKTISLNNITLTDLFRKPYSTESYDLEFELDRQTVIEILPVPSNRSKEEFSEHYTSDSIFEDED